jgi:hypothetical protein
MVRDVWRLVIGLTLPVKKTQGNGEELSTSTLILSFPFSNLIERERAYIRVTGTLKTFGSKRYINATHIRASKDVHELYFHILEAVTVNLIFERGPVSLIYALVFVSTFSNCYP